VAGELGTNLGDRMQALLERPAVTVVEAFGFEVDQLPHGPQVRIVEGRTDAAVALHRVEGGCALHLIRYDYDDDGDQVPPLDKLVLEVRLPFEPGDVEPLSPGGELGVSMELGSDGSVRLTLRQVPVYSIVSLPERS
jgi:hypothetical protein